MTQIELITSSRVENLSIPNLYGYILDKIEDERIVILEKSLDPQQQMELIALGLERVSKETYAGISFVPFFVTTHVNGMFKTKLQEVQFNLIAPGSSIIEETDDGVFNVTTKDGDIVSAAF